MTMLTWCEECSEDMHLNGGRSCKFCYDEFCFSCIKGHEEYCVDRPKPPEGE